MAEMNPSVISRYFYDMVKLLIGEEILTLSAPQYPSLISVSLHEMQYP
ncbi:MAG: hypothetical protein J5U19_15395 [Candidatus Methanoperedens sp.]|nr:hypothetical protein [Candidatus Methanoperedens sp.]